MNYKLYNDDCINVMNDLISKGVKVDSIITDPPYSTTSNETMGNIPRTNADCEYNKNMRYPSSVQKFNNRAKGARGLHPTQKPIELMEYLVKTYTKEGDTVLDFTMGSGTTGVACKKLNRNFIGIEKELKYFEIAKERINFLDIQEIE